MGRLRKPDIASQDQHLKLQQSPLAGVLGSREGRDSLSTNSPGESRSPRAHQSPTSFWGCLQSSVSSRPHLYTHAALVPKIEMILAKQAANLSLCQAQSCLDRFSSPISDPQDCSDSRMRGEDQSPVRLPTVPSLCPETTAAPQ